MTTARCGATLLLLLGTFALAGAGSARAAESRIPIGAQTTISASGTYVVTRDLVSSTSAVLTITAGDVTVDLNGHTLTQANPQAAVLLVSAAAHVTIRNGHLVGGYDGIVSTSNNGSGGSLQLTDVDVRGTVSFAVVTTSKQVTITRCTIADAGAGINVTTSTDDVQARIAGCSIRATGGAIVVYGLGYSVRGAVIADNTLRSSADSTLQFGVGTEGALVRRNTVFTGGSYGIYALGDGGHVIEGNVVRGAVTHGIYVTSNGVRVAGNTVTRAGQNGIEVDGQSCAIESNLAAENGNNGIDVVGPGNVVRNNTSRGNGGAGYNLHPGNVDAGGNY